MVKHADLVVYQAVRDTLEGKFSGGDVALGLVDGALALAPIGGDVDPSTSAAALSDVEALRAAVVSKRIDVPATLDELAGFRPPDPASMGLAHAVASGR
jgi:basic membrane protein A